MDMYQLTGDSKPYPLMMQIPGVGWATTTARRQSFETEALLLFFWFQSSSFEFGKEND